MPGSRPGWGARLLIAGGYLAVLLPAPAAGLVTAALMAAVAAVAAQAARRAPADRRPVLAAGALSAAALAVVWSLAAASAAGEGLQLVNDLALLTAAAVLVAGSIRGGWLHGAINALVVELGPSRVRPLRCLPCWRKRSLIRSLRYVTRFPGWAGSTREACPSMPRPLMAVSTAAE